MPYIPRNEQTVPQNISLDNIVNEFPNFSSRKRRISKLIFYLNSFIDHSCVIAKSLVELTNKQTPEFILLSNAVAEYHNIFTPDIIWSYEIVPSTLKIQGEFKFYRNLKPGYI